MSKQITVTLMIDPATAIRAGHSQAGETKLTLCDDDLAQLTDVQRETLARHVAGEDGYALPLTSGQKISEATVAVLGALLDARAIEAETMRQRRGQELVAEAREKIARMQQPKPKEMFFFRDGIPFHAQRAGEPTIAVDVPQCWVAHGSDVSTLAKYDSAAAQELQDAIDAAKAFNGTQIEDRTDEVSAAWALKDAAEARRQSLEEQATIERETYLKRLPEILRARYKAGYAAESEISEAILDLICSDENLAGYAELQDEQGSYDCAQLTDQEFMALQALSDAAPKDASLKAVVVYTSWQDQDGRLEEDDLPRDEDGDIIHGTFAQLTMKRAGIPIKLYRSIG